MLVDTTYLLRTLKRRAWILISIPLSVGTVTYFVAQDLPKKYKSIAQVSAGVPIKIGTMTSNGSMSVYETSTTFLKPC